MTCMKNIVVKTKQVILECSSGGLELVKEKEATNFMNRLFPAARLH